MWMRGSGTFSREGVMVVVNSDQILEIFPGGASWFFWEKRVKLRVSGLSKSEDGVAIHELRRLREGCGGGRNAG